MSRALRGPFYTQAGIDHAIDNLDATKREKAFAVSYEAMVWGNDPAHDPMYLRPLAGKVAIDVVMEVESKPLRAQVTIEPEAYPLPFRFHSWDRLHDWINLIEANRAVCRTAFAVDFAGYSGDLQLGGNATSEGPALSVYVWGPEIQTTLLVKPE